MLIEISKKFAETVGKQKFEQFGLSEGEWWRSTASRAFSLEKLSDEKIRALVTLLTLYRKHKRAKDLLANIEVWQKTQEIEDAGAVAARNPAQFAHLLKRHLAQVPGHRLYTFDTEHMVMGEGVWLAYYVDGIQYHPETWSVYNKKKVRHPPYVTVRLMYQKYEQVHTATITFDEHECWTTPHKALFKAGWYEEIDKLRQVYLAETRLYNDAVGNIGRQYWAQGTGSDDVDGNPSKGDSWYHQRTKAIPLTWNDGPAKVVSDVLNEGNVDGKDDDDRRSGRRKEHNPDPEFWKTSSAYQEHENLADADDADADDEDDTETDAPDDADDTGETDWDAGDAQDRIAKIEIPLHPYLVVFDLHKHLRLRVHVKQLTVYKYDTEIANKLVLPDDLKHLVRLLVESKGGAFEDIVAGKSGGAIVLLAGKPGVGKTLTAEVFAENEQRPLYSVQCSQLGTDSNTIENTLLKVFARAKRWDAVTLLDEADVYIRERGTDIEQNAIVGVFLRVLEYQSKVLFLTTNRPDDVDDAVGSRCIAKLIYEAPTSTQQAEIWRVLADGAGIKISDAAIKAIVAKSHGITGRDIKNLLKLGRLMAGKDGVTAEVIERVKRFKPTNA